MNIYFTIPISRRSRKITLFTWGKYGKVRYSVFQQGKDHAYGHIRCTYTVLVNPTSEEDWKEKQLYKQSLLWNIALTCICCHTHTLILISKSTTQVYCLIMGFADMLTKGFEWAFTYGIPSSHRRCVVSLKQLAIFVYKCQCGVLALLPALACSLSLMHAGLNAR